ncbi:hypothetical protein E2C01_021056 [Portunus trituberculatus]|uniref:Uncharacterized protein n=1 Tax=Portunus trituberculatus TaxID=210409 RepID=A0A5B7E284_PORTR|nr:hypothetical protein [Portunus trituberculatus]
MFSYNEDAESAPWRLPGLLVLITLFPPSSPVPPVHRMPQPPTPSSGSLLSITTKHCTLFLNHL